MKHPITSKDQKLIENNEVYVTRQTRLQDTSGKIGYLVAWLLGVPAWILLLVFLIKG